MHRPTLAAAVALALIAAAHAADPDPAALVRDYKALKDLTPQGHQTDLGLAMLCRGASSQEIAESTKELGPHAFSRIHVFVDPRAEKALRAKSKVFPVGAVFIKEKQAGQATWRQPGEKLALRRNGVTGMIKRAPGYDPKHGDWEYFIQEEGGKLERGRIPTCVACHAKAKGPDHVFATWWSESRR